MRTTIIEAALHLDEVKDRYLRHIPRGSWLRRKEAELFSRVHFEEPISRQQAERESDFWLLLYREELGFKQGIAGIFGTPACRVILKGLAFVRCPLGPVESDSEFWIPDEQNASLGTVLLLLDELPRFSQIRFDTESRPFIPDVNAFPVYGPLGLEYA